MYNISSWFSRTLSNLSGMAKRGASALQLKQQLFKCILMGLSGLAVTGVCVYVFAGEKEAKPDRQYKTSLTGGSDRFSPQKAWFEQVSTKLDDITQRLSSLEGRSSSLGGSSSPQGHSSQQGRPHSLEENSFQQEHSTPLEQSDSSKLPDTSIDKESASLEGGVNPSSDNVPNEGLTSTVIEKKPQEPKRPHTRGIHHVALSRPSTKTLKTGDNTIPAGAFAEGVLLGGVDASTSIQASSDPRPVLLRLTNPGTLPRRFKSDLCGCHVLAACYGDISSERVFMRLEKITCTERKTGEIVEMNVKGYVAGEDGRAGLRGTVVDRAGESVRNAAVGGFIGGMAGFISQANQNPVTYSLASGLSQTPGMTGGDMLRHGAAKGAGNALEKYADFYIKRAEQMQPVIQVQAGRIVDIVTTESTPFEDSAERRSLIHVNDRKRYEQVNLPSLEGGQTQKEEGDGQ